MLFCTGWGLWKEDLVLWYGRQANPGTDSNPSICLQMWTKTDLFSPQFIVRLQWTITSWGTKSWFGSYIIDLQCIFFSDQTINLEKRVPAFIRWSNFIRFFWVSKYLRLRLDECVTFWTSWSRKISIWFISLEVVQNYQDGAHTVLTLNRRARKFWRVIVNFLRLRRKCVVPRWTPPPFVDKAAKQKARKKPWVFVF